MITFLDNAFHSKEYYGGTRNHHEHATNILQSTTKIAQKYNSLPHKVEFYCIIECMNN